MSAAPVRERAPGLSRRRLWGFVPFTAMSAAPLPPLGTGISSVVGSYAHQCTGNADLLCRTGADHRGVSPSTRAGSQRTGGRGVPKPGLA